MTEPGEWPERPGLRFLLRMSFRRSELCGGAHACPDAGEARCEECGAIYRPDDPADCHCPECASTEARLLECDGCWLPKLDDAVQGEMGSVINRVVDLDFALEAGFTISLDHVSAEEFRVLRILKEERQKYQAHLEKKNAQQLPAIKNTF